ncbi:MAG: HAD-IA family hydrolase [Burkholderiaceae bacterium]|nr:HAD-IA family hydrolase [Burkholderiaceae bacterium]
MPGHFDCALFDLDGTLIDSATDLARAAEVMRAARGMSPIPIADYRAHAGSGARGMIAVAFGITPESEGYGALKDEFLDAYTSYMFDHTVFFDGVPALLQALGNARLPWGIVTNKAERLALALAQAMPPLGSAHAIVGGDTTPHAKPHPVPLLEAARRIGVDPARCLYVGDDERDMRAGRAAGMRTVAALYGYLGPGADVALWPTDWRIRAPGELLQLIGLA